MALDELLQLVQTLRERAEKHKALLQQSEALTRYVLIDPVLRALGWDTEDPTLVRPEYTAGTGAADYALLTDGKPIAFVESKALGKPLSQGLNQSINYCIQTGTPFFVVTDGLRWEVYETHRPVPLEEKRIAQFELEKGDLKEAVLGLLHLWKPGATPPAPIAVTSGPPPSGSWTPLSEVQPQPRQHPPSKLRFPDGKETPIRYWNGVLIAIAEYLARQGLLTPAQCPLKHPNASTRYVVNSTPTHPNGNAFFAPKQVGSVYVETPGSASEAVKYGRLLIQKLGQDPAKFALAWE